ncbi:MAG: hypothetical protein FWC85_01860, partial [Elusimicrobia bacterium]|nr:hypothetical protein [Elusimicrobiota bacterium]
EYLIVLARQHNINLALHYPELNTFFEYFKLSQKINPVELISEEVSLRNEINSRFASTQAQREVIFLINFTRYLRALLTSKITAKDYAFFIQNIYEYRRLWARHIDNRVLSLLEPFIEEAEKFYYINLVRDKFFVQNLGLSDGAFPETYVAILQNNPVLSQALGVLYGRNVKVMVAGGFHTKGVSQILRDKNVSYIVITHNVTGGLAEAQEVYHRVALAQARELSNGNLIGGLIVGGTGSIETSALANLILSLTPAARVEFINAFQTGQDLTGLEISGMPAADGARLEYIRAQIAGAKLLESDTEGDVIDKLVTVINEVLTENRQVTRERLLDSNLNLNTLVNFINSPAQLEILLSNSSPVAQIYKDLARALRELLSRLMPRAPPSAELSVVISDPQTHTAEIQNLLAHFHMGDADEHGNLRNTNFAHGTFINENDKPDEGLTPRRIKDIIDRVVDVGGFNGIEVSMFWYGEGRNHEIGYRGPAIFWHQRHGVNGRPMFPITRLIEEYEVVLAELNTIQPSGITLAEEIRNHAQNNNMRLSGHLNTAEFYASDALNSPVIRPVPVLGTEAMELFKRQIDIAALLGMDNVILHLSSLDNSRGYAEIIKYAARKGIRINFENEMLYAAYDGTDAFAAYRESLIAGYATAEQFVQGLTGIREELLRTSEGRRANEHFFGVVLDTSKALNSFTQAVVVNATTIDELSDEEKAQIEQQLANINLENLIAYYNAIINAGFEVNQLHLSQFQRDIASVRIEKGVGAENRNYAILYNKRIIDSTANPAFDMAQFLQFLHDSNFQGILEQETANEFVSPAVMQQELLLTGTDDGLLTLGYAARFADFLGLSDDGNIIQIILRNVVISILEAPFSILPVIFVNMHYRRGAPREHFALRTFGATLIQAYTAAGIVISLLTPVSFILPLVLNVITHTVYNLFILHAARLELGITTQTFIPSDSFFEAAYAAWLDANKYNDREDTRTLKQLLAADMPVDQKQNEVFLKIYEWYNYNVAKDVMSPSSYEFAMMLNTISSLIPLSIRVVNGVLDLTLFNRLLEFFESLAKECSRDAYSPAKSAGAGIIKIAYLYDIDLSAREVLSSFKSSLLSDYELSSLTNMASVFQWLSQNFPMLITKADGNIEIIRAFFEDFLGVNLNINWSAFETIRHTPGHAIASRLGGIDIDFNDEILFIQEKISDSASSIDGSTGRLIEEFLNFNKIALRELGANTDTAIALSVNALNKMITIVREFDESIASEAQARLSEILNELSLAITFETISAARAKVNSVINFVHQQGMRKMRVKDGSYTQVLVHRRSPLVQPEIFTLGSFHLEINNYTGKPLSPDMKEFFSGLLLNGRSNGRFYIVGDNKVIWEHSIGEHSFYAVIDFKDLTEGLTFVYNDNVRRNTENAKRVKMFAIEAVQNGMDITHLDIRVNEFTSFDPAGDDVTGKVIPGVCGFNAVFRPTDRKRAPSQYSNMINTIYRMMQETAGLDNAMAGGSMHEYIGTTHARLSERTRNNSVGDCEQIKAILPQVRGTHGYPNIAGITLFADVMQELLNRDGIRLSPLRNHRLIPEHIYNELGIYNPQDRTVAEIERRFVENRLKIENGELIRNTEFMPAGAITRALSDNIEKTFEVASIVNQLNIQDLSLRSEAVIGRMTASSGVLRLRNGYLSIKGVINTNTNALECAFVELVTADGVRTPLTAQKLKQILIENGHAQSQRITINTPTPYHIAYVQRQLNSQVFTRRMLEVHGIAVSDGLSSGRITYDSNMPAHEAQGRILIHPLPEPSDIEGIATRFQGLISKLNKWAHSSVLLREKRLPVLSVPSAAMADGKLTVSVYRYAEAAHELNGFNVIEITEFRTTLEEGQYITFEDGRALLYNALDGNFINDDLLPAIRNQNRQRIREIIKWDNSQESRENIAQILNIIFAQTYGKEGFEDFYNYIKEIFVHDGLAGEILRELEASAIYEVFIKVDEMARNAVALREKFALKAFTVALNAESLVSSLPQDTAGKVLQKRQEIAVLKRETFMYVRTAVENWIMASRAALSARRPDVDEIHRLRNQAAVWNNFYNFPGVADIAYELNTKFRRLRAEAGQASRPKIKLLEQLTALDINYSGSKSYNVKLLKYIAPDIEKLRFADGFVLNESVIISLLDGKTVEYNGRVVTYQDILNEFSRSRGQPLEQAEFNMLIQARDQIVGQLELSDFIRLLEENPHVALDPSLTYAIRSSGVGEDGNRKSGAGLGETELSIPGTPEAVFEGIKYVLKSFIKPSSFEYLKNGGVHMRPAILVQEMATNVVSAGQIFTADIFGNTGMEGVWGLGEGSVSGRVAADSINFKAGDNVYLYAKASERIMKIVPNPEGGTMAVPLATFEKDEEVFTREVVQRIFAFARRAENIFGYPLDIEFAIDAENYIWPLQARPITTFVRENYDISQGNFNFEFVILDTVVGDSTNPVQVGISQATRSASPSAVVSAAQVLSGKIIVSENELRHALAQENINVKDIKLLVENPELARSLQSQGLNAAVVSVEIRNSPIRKSGSRVLQDENGIFGRVIINGNKITAYSSTEALTVERVVEGLREMAQEGRNGFGEINTVILLANNAQAGDIILRIKNETTYEEPLETTLNLTHLNNNVRGVEAAIEASGSSRLLFSIAQANARSMRNTIATLK